MRFAGSDPVCGLVIRAELESAYTCEALHCTCSELSGARTLLARQFVECSGLTTQEADVYQLGELWCPYQLSSCGAAVFFISRGMEGLDILGSYTYA